MESLNKTYFVDLDGTLLEHQTNDELDEMIQDYGTRSFLHEKPLKTSLKFFKSIDKKDMIIFTTARCSRHKDHTIRVLQRLGIKYKDILFDINSGARFLVNDMKPKGSVGNTLPFKTAYAINLERDKGMAPKDVEVCKLKPDQQIRLIT